MKFASLLLPLILAWAQHQPPEPQAAKPPDKCAIEGQILNAATGEPLKRAQVLLIKPDPPFRTPNPEAISDSSGKFAMNNIPPGKYRLHANRNGFVGASYGARRPRQLGTTLSLESGQNVKDLVLKLTPCGVITGRVLDEDGEPLPRVFIQVFRYAWVQGKHEMANAGGDDTNDLGEYRVYDLAPGRYYVSATYRPGVVWNAGGVRLEEVSTTPSQEGYAKVYYPNTIDVSAAVPLHVMPGVTLRGTDFVIRKFPTFRVTGRVTGPLRNRNGQRPNVYLRPCERIWPALDHGRATVDSQGNFVLHGVIRGSYYLVAELVHSDKRYIARQLVNVGDSDVEDISLNLFAAIDWTGHVRVEGDQPLRNAGDLTVSFRTRGDSPFAGFLEHGAVKDDGSFTLHNVGPDIYDVGVYGFRDNFYVKSVKLGDDDVTESGIDGSRATAASLEILLSPGGGHVNGVVQDDKHQPAGGAAVVLIPNSHRDRLQLYKTTNTDQHGRFTLKGIGPGDYKLFAWADLESAAYYDAEFLKQVEGQGESLHVIENGHETKQLTLIFTEDLKKE